MIELDGWLTDVYPGTEPGIALWLLCSDGIRRRLIQPFTITFYAAGKEQRLHALQRYLEAQPVPVNLFRTRRRDLFQAEPVDVLAVETADVAGRAAPTFRASRLHLFRPDLL